MIWYRFRGRVCRALVLVAAISSSLVCIQIFSSQYLPQSSVKESLPRQDSQGSVKREEKCKSTDCLTALSTKDKPVQKEKVQKVISQKTGIFWDWGIEQSIVNPDLLSHKPRGTPWNLAQYYLHTGSSFTCIGNGVKIPSRQVNDDYCDCTDGSDEPSTSACHNGRFYCTFQLSDKQLVWFPSSRVDDFICDCCDGSDEISGLCPDKCDAARREQAALLELRAQGREAKVQYLQSANELPESEKSQYGTGGVFYKLSLECFSHPSGEYSYEICPFRYVKQQRFPAIDHVIGRNGRWQEGVLIMDGGDSVQCPGNKLRRARIWFKCGTFDRVLSVNEDELCSYAVIFSSPAAC